MKPMSIGGRTTNEILACASCMSAAYAKGFTCVGICELCGVGTCEHQWRDGLCSPCCFRRVRSSLREVPPSSPRRAGVVDLPLGGSVEIRNLRRIGVENLELVVTAAWSLVETPVRIGWCHDQRGRPMCLIEVGPGASKYGLSMREDTPSERVEVLLAMLECACVRVADKRRQEQAEAHPENRERRP